MVNVNKIKNLAKEQGITITHLCSLVGKQRGWLKDIKIKNLDISDENLIKIADALNTTVEYLRDETEEKEKPLTEQGFTEEEKRLLELYNKASEEDKKVIMRMLESFVKENKDKELRRNRL